jgi:hypothetical protein
MTFGRPLAFYGLPLLAIVGSGIAIIGVWGLSKAMGTDAWTTVSRLLRPPGALGRAVLPLLLAAAVVCFFASAELGPILQIASGVLLAALVWLLVRGRATEIMNERVNVKDFGRAILPTTPYPRSVALPLLISVAAPLGFLMCGFGLRQIDTWKSAAGWSGVSEYIGLVLLATAAALRIFGYATNRWRAVVAIALALLAL